MVFLPARARGSRSSTGKQAALDFASQITGIRGRLVIAGYHQDEFKKINLRLWDSWRLFSRWRSASSGICCLGEKFWY